MSLLGATAVVGIPGVALVSTTSDVSNETEACWVPDELCSLKRDRSFSSRVFMSSIPGALGCVSASISGQCVWGWLGSKAGWGWLWISVCCTAGTLATGCAKGGIVGTWGNKGVEVGPAAWARTGVEAITEGMTKGCTPPGWEMELDTAAPGEEEEEGAEWDKANPAVLLWDILSSECALTTTVSASVGAEVLLLSWRDGCEAMLGNGVVLETEVNVAAPVVVLPADGWDNAGGGLAPGALLTAEAEVVETGLEGKVPILETTLPDVGARTDWDVADVETTAGIVMPETMLESTGDSSDTGGTQSSLEVTLVQVVIPFSVGTVISDWMTDVEMSLRGQLVIGTDTESVVAAVVGTPAMLPMEGGTTGNVGPVWLKLGGAVLGPSVIWAFLSSEKACCRLRDEAEWDKFIPAPWDVEAATAKEKKKFRISPFLKGGFKRMS